MWECVRRKYSHLVMKIGSEYFARLLMHFQLKPNKIKPIGNEHTHWSPSHRHSILSIIRSIISNERQKNTNYIWTVAIKSWHIFLNFFSLSLSVSGCVLFLRSHVGSGREFHRNFSSLIGFFFPRINQFYGDVLFLFCCTVLLTFNWMNRRCVVICNKLLNFVWCSSDELNSYIG